MNAKLKFFYQFKHLNKIIEQYIFCIHKNINLHI